MEQLLLFCILLSSERKSRPFNDISFSSALFFIEDVSIFSDKPRFDPGRETVVDLVEGQEASINMTALANPTQVEYRWAGSDGQLPTATGGDREMKSLNEARAKRVYSDKGVLTLTKVERRDSGYYTVRATNEEGASETRIMINVLYPPR